MSNLVSRVLTAVVAVPIILGLLYFLPWWAFALLAGGAQAVGALELLHLTHRDDRVGRIFGSVLSTFVFTTLVLTNFGSHDSFLTIIVLVSVVPFALLFTLFRPGDHSTALVRMAALSMGPFYVGTSLAALACLRRIEPGGVSRVGAGLAVLALMIAWFNDTAAYFVGKGLGGPKLYPSVSPNKTWSGAVGGLLGSAVGALLAHFWYLPELPLDRGLAVALATGALGQAGDLCESLMKRSAGVKDSGGVLPGHGGILDRLDALMFVALALYVLVRSGWLLEV